MYAAIRPILKEVLASSTEKYSQTESIAIANTAAYTIVTLTYIIFVVATQSTFTV